MNDVHNASGDRQLALDVRASAFDRFDACAAVLDRDGTIVDTNRAWRLFAHLNDGPSDSTGVGVNYLGVCDRAARAGAIASADVATGLRQILQGECGHFSMEYPCASPTEDRWFLLQASAMPVRDGAGAVVFHLDITAHKQLTDRLGVLADHDPLTGLPNRRSAIRYLDEQLAVVRATGDAVSVLYFDIDKFKSVNDTFGHHVGDELLIKVGVRARRALRDSDRLCRVGGDELVAICPGLDHACALALADRLRAVMEAPFQIGDVEVHGCISVGVAEGDATSTPDTMLEIADENMYADKRKVSSHPGAALDPAARPGRLTERPPGDSGQLHQQSATDTDHRARADAALKNTKDLILFLTAERTIEWASPACTSLLGIRPEDIVGLGALELIHPDDRARVLDAFDAIPNTGDHMTTHFRVTDTNGKIRWIKQTATNLLDDPTVGSIVVNLRDATERVSLLEQIDLGRRRLADAQAAARLGRFEIHLRTGDICRSDEVCRILGLPPGAWGNIDALDNIHPDDRGKLTALIEGAAAGLQSGEVEYRVIRPDGETRWVLAQGVRLVAPNDVIAGTLLDITDRHLAEEALSFQATHDWLTGLPNPAGLHARLHESLSTTGSDTNVLVAAIGVDNFHQINEACGTLNGDAVLLSLAARLTTQSQPSDIIARVRDDGFVVVRTAPSTGLTAAEFGRALKELAGDHLATVDDHPAQQPLTFSVGVTTSTKTDTSESILADAAAAMQEARRNGGDRVTVFDDHARTRATRHRSISAALPAALEQHQLHLEYQPILDLTTRRTVGFEALLRWTHPDLGDISPDEFIPIAEANRMIVPIGTWVFETAVRQLAVWTHELRLPTKPWMAINLSAQQLSDDQLATRFSDTINRNGVAPTSVHLEITESILMYRIEHAAQTIAHLHSLGLNISVDDFGTGYSSLSYLSRLTVDTLKIDRSFINALSGARADTSIVRAMITLADSLGLDVIAEGIESAGQLQALQALGCSKGQGFLWSRPLHPDAALQWLIHESETGCPATAGDDLDNAHNSRTTPDTVGQR